MMHNSDTLYAELNKHLFHLTQQIDAVMVDTQKSIDLLPYPENVTVFNMKTAEGIPVLSTLLCAKAQLLSGMAALKAADVASKQPRR